MNAKENEMDTATVNCRMRRLIRRLSNETAIKMTHDQWGCASAIILEAMHELDTAKQLQWLNMRSERDDALADTMKMTKAIHDSINKPKGVVPKSASDYYDPGYYESNFRK